MADTDTITRTDVEALIARLEDPDLYIDAIDDAIAMLRKLQPAEPSELFAVTDDWMIAHTSARGGWSKAQLATVGVMWPPARGWRRRLVTRSISQEQRLAFEAFKGR